MDARLDPAKYAGLAEGDVHVIRNAGGRASDDALRSLLATGLDPQKATISTG
jgi:carbonic anhydrase